MRLDVLLEAREIFSEIPIKEHERILLPTPQYRKLPLARTSLANTGEDCTLASRSMPEIYNDSDAPGPLVRRSGLVPNVALGKRDLVSTLEAKEQLVVSGIPVARVLSGESATHLLTEDEAT